MATAKCNLKPSQRVVLGFLAGVYIAMGSLLAVKVGYGFPTFAADNAGVIRLFMGIVFPVGLIMVVLAGADLFTGNCGLFVPNMLNKKVDALKASKALATTWIANFIGSLFFGYFMVYLTGLSSMDSTYDGFMAIAEIKTCNPFYVTLLKGIGANWLVCLALWLGMSSRSITGKILGLWFPIMAFVAIGYEHSIANMFFLPVAIMEGFDLTLADMFIKNIIPATLGNMIGGGLFVGGLYWFVYDRES